MKAILTDIEGTTTDIHFVHDVLFPYAKQHVEPFIMQHWDDPQISQIIADIKNQIQNPVADPAAIITTLKEWMQADLKITPLKSLQGIMWKAGYERGDFRGHVYQDAYEKLQTWHQQKIALYIFSSGSIAAQKLLFKYSVFSDLTHLFSGYFDTTTGAKKSIDAYHKIAAQINLPISEILFLSDSEEELDAAKNAGLQTCWVIRTGELPKDSEHQIVRTFAEIF